MKRGLTLAKLLVLVLFLGIGYGAFVSIRPSLIQNPVLARITQSDAVNRAAVELHYSPSEDLEQIDLHALHAAHKTVEMFAYSLTDERIIKMLKADALERNAAVFVYLDNEQTANELHRPYLREALLDLAATPHVSVKVKRSRILQHIKGYLVDGGILREGSANFSADALTRQDNTLFLSSDPNLIRGFDADFRTAWAREDNIDLVDFAQQIE